MWCHNDNCIVTSLSNDIIRHKILIFSHVMKSRHLILVKFFWTAKIKILCFNFLFLSSKSFKRFFKKPKKNLKKKNFKKKSSDWYWTPSMGLQVLHFTLIAIVEFSLHKNLWGRNFFFTKIHEEEILSWYWFFTCVTKHSNTHIHTLKKHWEKQSWLCVDYWLIKEADFTVKAQLKIRKTLSWL